MKVILTGSIKDFYLAHFPINVVKFGKLVLQSVVIFVDEFPQNVTQSYAGFTDGCGTHDRDTVLLLNGNAWHGVTDCVLLFALVIFVFGMMEILTLKVTFSFIQKTKSAKNFRNIEVVLRRNLHDFLHFNPVWLKNPFGWNILKWNDF